MNREAIALGIECIIYIGFLAGLSLIFRDCLAYIALRKRLKKRLGAGIKKKPALPEWALWPSRLASAALGREIDPASVIWALAATFFSVLALSARTLSPPAALIYSLLFCALPLLLLALRLKDIQSRASREGIALVTELARQYRMQNRNIYRALEAAVSSEGDFPLCRKQIYLLLIRLRSASGGPEIGSACRDLAYSLGTVWGSMLSTCIRVSAEKGSDVSEGLSDIADQLKAANRRMEERKRLNSEAGRMAMFMVPILYIGTMALSVGYLGIKPSDLFKNQFLSPEGLMMFLICVLLFLFNLTLLRLISRARLDL